MESVKIRHLSSGLDFRLSNLVSTSTELEIYYYYDNLDSKVNLDMKPLLTPSVFPFHCTGCLIDSKIYLYTPTRFLTVGSVFSSRTAPSSEL
jgi:hypothetical protein